MTSLKDRKKAVVLCSGGLDSTTVLYMALDEGYEVFPVSFDYRQRHSIELQFLRKTLEKLNLIDNWVIFHLDFSQIKKSALVDFTINVPKDREVDDMLSGIPVSYVPLRNTIFLSYAAARAEAINATDIFIGVNAVDYSGYPDCRPEYIESIERALSLGSKYVDDPSREFKIHTPLINLSKTEIIERGLSLGVDYSLTWSCYDPVIEDNTIKPCGKCDSCILRNKGFEGITKDI
ncbi:MAG: 7-cyano-7-deazaguanine synthase QueC [Promethearchaeota archaeon]